MPSKKPDARAAKKNLRQLTRNVEQLSASDMDDAIKAVQNLLRSGKISNELADALLSILLSGYVSYTILEGVDGLTDYILETFDQMELPENG